MGELFPPYNQFQSKNSTRRSDCACCAALWSLRFATDSSINPQAREKIDELLSELRHKSNPVKAPPAITMREIEKGFESVSAAHAKSAPKMKRHSGGSMEDDLWPAISSGDAALVMVNYGVVNRRRPGLSGSPGFMGGHAITVANGRDKNGARVVTVADSTRNKLVTWPWWLLVRAAGLYGSNPHGVGKGEFGIVRKANAPAEPHPKPEPPDDDEVARLKRRIANLREEIDELEAQLAASQVVNAELTETIRRIREMLDKAEKDGSADALGQLADEDIHALVGATGGEVDDGPANDSDAEEGAAQDDGIEPDTDMGMAAALAGVGRSAGGVDVRGSTRVELLAQAKTLKIRGRWRMNKQELGKAIARARSR